MQFRRGDNEAAIRLYERALAADSDSPEALAGLSSCLVQRALRWPDGRDAEQLSDSALGAALESGQLQRPAVAATIERALQLARRAAARAPRDPDILRALGLALSASGRLADAAAVYDRALAVDPAHWGVLINRADLYDITGEPATARVLLERAYTGMSRDYISKPARVRPWQARLGVVIAHRYEQGGDLAGARHWYARTLYDDPSSEDARRQLDRLRHVVTI